jgi:SAM-dependent methyltransferase
MKSAIYAQFSKPTGVLGRVAGWIMAKRPSNRARNRWTVELLDVEPSDRVLELGFGPGLSIDLIAQRVFNGSVVGIDHSTVMLEQALLRNRRWVALGRVHLYEGVSSSCRRSAYSTRSFRSTCCNSLPIVRTYCG